MSAKIEDWADRRANDFVEKHLPDRMSLVRWEKIRAALADEFRSLAAACEPRSPLDL